MGVDVLHSLAVDYVTATTSERDSAGPFRSFASALFRSQAEMGNIPKPWAGSGFKGWQCGQVQISTLDHAVMVRLSGDQAARSWRRVVELSDNVSRFDVQATVIVCDGVTRRIDRHRRKAARHSAKLHYKPIVRWIQDVRGGYTLYLGARESFVFGRIYDKWQREKLDHFQNCVRYEVQFQRKLARIVANGLVQVDSPRPRFASYVSQFFTGRGVDPELPATDKATYCCSRTRGDVDRNLEWLAKAVRPTVSRLINAGRGEDVFRALGLICESESPDQEIGPETSTD